MPEQAHWGPDRAGDGVDDRRHVLDLALQGMVHGIPAPRLSPPV